MSKIIIAYIPALHQGYVLFLQKFSDRTLYLVSDELLGELKLKKPYYGRDIRAVSSVLMKPALAALGLVKEVKELNRLTLASLQEGSFDIVAPNEDITHDVIQSALPKAPVVYNNTFLRWDKKISEQEYQVGPDRVISRTEFDRQLMRQADAESLKSYDWWRQIGALAVKNDQVVVSSFNKNLPRPDNPSVLGDPRSNFDAGVRIDLVTTIHAEAGVIATAANKGISLAGASLYTTTFPCPPCARLIITAGIKKLYYAKGYSLLDSEELLKQAGVEICLVA